MYLLKNAWRNVARSKGRNILIGFIIFVISISACISLSIQQAAEDAKTTGMENVEIKGQITVDRQSAILSMEEDGNDRSQMKEKMSQMESLSAEELQKYAKSDAVKNFYYTLTASLNGENIEVVNMSSSEDNESEQNRIPQNEDKGNANARGDFSLVGYSSEEAMTDFIDGTCQLTDGEMFQEGKDDQTCIISDELASYNSLEVGDTITFQNPLDSGESVKLTIAGIYNNSSSTSTEDGMITKFQSMSDPANQILMSYETLKAITDDMDSVFSQVNGTYVFANQKNYEQFQDDVKEMGLDDTYTVTSQDINSYEQSLVPLESLSQFAGYFLIVVLIIGAIVLVVLNLFHIRERKYEIGVLTAIGMKKRKVCIQFIMEIFIVTILAMIIGIAAGSAVSVPVSNQLLESQIESQEQQMSDREINFGREISGEKENNGKIDNAKGRTDFVTNTKKYVSDISATVNLSVVAKLFGVGILLALISSFVAVISVIRYEPLQILSNRS